MFAFLRSTVLIGALLIAGLTGASCLSIYPCGERAETLETHTCFSLCLGMRETLAKDHVVYHGLTAGLLHTSMGEHDVLRAFRNERCDFNGASIQLLSQLNIGTLRGASITGLVAIQRNVYGLQLSGLTNNADLVVGMQTSAGMNLTKQTRGLQLGFLNITNELKGVQIGLININRAGWILPLINMSF